MKKEDEVGFLYLLRDCIRAICAIRGWFELRNSGLTRTPELGAMSWRKMLEQMIVSESPRCTK